MEFATGALGTLLPKLASLLQDEYNLQKNVRKNIEFLTKELEIMQAALRSVGEVPTEQLQELVRIWARDARELSYDMEDVVDTFLVRVQGPDRPSKRSSKRFIRKMKSMLAVGKRHEIGEQIEDIKERVVELAARRDRYNFDTGIHVTSVDPRIKVLYAKTTELVSIDEARNEIISKLTKGDDRSTLLQKIVSIVGFGGLGKTTLAKAVYDEIKLQFDCSAFVTVSRNPNMKKFLKDMLYELDKGQYGNIHSTSLDVNHLIDLVRGFITNKRYFIIIDDIWDISNWENTIKLALLDNNMGYRIITTTRNLTVAKHIGGAYEMKPLSLNSSRLLLYQRIFGNDGPEKCLEEDLTKISDKILKKCAGVPLAIITIASLLTSKGRNQMQWFNEVYKSLGSGMENNLDSRNMRKILSYSYYDLPSHLKTCLLYLSMFPEDFEIDKESLIWLWRAEGFIQHKEHGKSQFEIGESYFNELINRSLIQPVIDSYGVIDACRIHDMVLDLLCSLSLEENFISICNHGNLTTLPTTTRRLSIQIQGTHLSFPKLRSAVFFASVLDAPSFNVLRVLVLRSCKLGQGYDLKYLRNLFHLRYLGLSHTEIEELPEEIVNLQFLETLKIREYKLSCLPSTIVQLRKLISISMNYVGRIIPNGIGNLRSLEHLSWLSIDDESMDHIEGLGLLTELRVLRISLSTGEFNDKLVGSLLKLRKIECLEIDLVNSGQRNIGGLDDWVAPQRLRVWQTARICWFSRLPMWLNTPWNLLDLYKLDIAVKEMQQKDLDNLGRLPNLRKLWLKVDHEDLGIHGEFVVDVNLFPCLETCYSNGFVSPLVFRQGAMPRVKNLYLDFHVWAVRDIAGSGGGFDLGLGNLLSLQTVWITFQGSSSKENFVEAYAALKQATEMHPNRPTFFSDIKDCTEMHPGKTRSRHAVI